MSNQPQTKLWDRPRIAWNKGKHHSKKTKLKISIGNKGKKQSQETKEKISIANIGHECTEKTRQKISIGNKGQVSWNKGIKCRKETKQKLRIIMLGRKLSKETKLKISLNNARGMLGKHHTKKTKQKIKESRKNIILPKKDTKPEKMVQIALALEGIKFEKHKTMKMGRNYLHPDIFIEPNICIQIHGCYFHYCPICFRDKKPNKIQLNNIIRDQRTIPFLNSNGYQVIIIWEHMIKDQNKSILKAQNYINLIKGLLQNQENIK